MNRYLCEPEGIDRRGEEGGENFSRKFLCCVIITSFGKAFPAVMGSVFCSFPGFSFVL